MNVTDHAEAFEAAREKVLTLSPRVREGIGTQKEKTLHAILKNTFDPDPSHQEIPIDGYIADIFDGHGIIEIQTANFGNLRDKLKAYLPEHKVLVVYPIPHLKYVTWIDPESGELKERNKSPRKGSFYRAEKELYRIRPFLTDPNLSIDLVLCDMEEYRVKDGWGSNGKRGSHRYDRVPVRIAGEKILNTREDYASLLPENLPDPFTSGDLRTALSKGNYGVDFSTWCLLLSEVGVIERIGKKRGRSFLYRQKV